MSDLKRVCSFGAPVRRWRKPKRSAQEKIEENFLWTMTIDTTYKEGVDFSKYGRLGWMRSVQHLIHAAMTTRPISDRDLRELLSSDQAAAIDAVLASQNTRKNVHVVCCPTGFGKTLIAVELVNHFVDRGYKILWITNKWSLLKQARQELVNRYPKFQSSRISRRIGGESDCLSAMVDGGDGTVFFTTLQTWKRRQKIRNLPSKIARRKKKLLIIWDEIHWAFNAPLGKAFTRHYLTGQNPSYNPLVVGLTATPVLDDQRLARIVWKTSYSEGLSSGRLAQPIIKNVKTGVIWDPILKRDHLISQESLNELASNADRNEMIVKELIEGRQRGDYTKSVLFACNIAHALKLNRMIAAAGVSTRVVHSAIDRKSQEEAINDFTSGKIEALINVNLLTEGNNIPAIDAVFVCRPTTSKRMLTQMIGRGSRITPTKNKFWIVEFTDIIRQNADEFFHAACVLTDVHPRTASTRENHRRRPIRHEEPNDLQLEEIALPDLGCITIAQDQTFGIEIELTSKLGTPAFGTTEWIDGATTIVNRLRRIEGIPVCPSPLGYHENEDPTRWVVENDSSAGWEVVSPILRNAEGFEELRQVCEALTDLEKTDGRFRVNYQCGLHVTLGTRLNSEERIKGFVKRLQRLEPGLMTLVAPSRIFHFGLDGYDLNERNDYCLPVRETIEDVDKLRWEDFVEYGARYRTVNLSHAYEDIEKLEIRLHSGTTEFRKIAPWISLWMLIFNNSRYRWEGEGVHGPVFPGGNTGISETAVENEDIFTLLRREGIFPHRDLLRLLWERRRQLRASWERVLPLRVASWTDAGWYSAEVPFVAAMVPPNIDNRPESSRIAI